MVGNSPLHPGSEYWGCQRQQWDAGLGKPTLACPRERKEALWPGVQDHSEGLGSSDACMHGLRTGVAFFLPKRLLGITR